MFLIDTEKFAEYLDKLRIEIPQLAEKIGLSKNQVYKIQETGRTSRKSAGKIADAFGCNIEDLKRKSVGRGEAVSVVTGEVRDNIAPYNDPSSKLFSFAVAKIRQAGLTEDEENSLRKVLCQVIDIFTIMDPEERRKCSAFLENGIELYHQTVFPHGGSEGNLSSLKEEGKQNKQ